MLYYKKGNNYEARATPTPDGVEITKEEYENAVAEIEAMIELEVAESERLLREREERMEELEHENAALLFQLLTGEEFTE